MKPDVVIVVCDRTAPTIDEVAIHAIPIVTVGAAIEVVVARKDADLPDLRLPRDRPARDWEQRKYRKPKVRKR